MGGCACAPSSERRSMNSLGLTALTNYRTTFADDDAVPGKETDDGADTTKYNLRVADDLYEWLRAMAFYARVSMNSVVVAARRRYRAARHADETAPLSLEQTSSTTKEGH